jgi:DNA helicase IV
LSSDSKLAQDNASDDVDREQKYVSTLYDRVDQMRSQAEERLASALREVGGTMQARSERDSAVAMYSDQIAQLDGVENGLCFGRLDFDDDRVSYIGRIGLFDDSGDYEPLLVDWRAPAARSFYLATAASPDGVRRRRHIRTRDRKVVGLDDEILDLAAARAIGDRADLTSEAALLAALGASRTGRMRDIVETIQAEQDRIIRSDLGGVLVVQGGPGTGKTAVALHRAAYLLYTFRQHLSTRAVLVVGPNTTFLRYISQVLPSLAETGVLLCTLGDLFPGETARLAEPAATAEIKGRSVMAEVLASAVRERQRIPDEAVELTVDREVLRLEPHVVKYAREQARRSGQLHNLARPIFARFVVEALARQLAERIGTDPYADDPLGGDDAPGDPNLFGAADMADIRADVVAEPAVQAELDRLWPMLTPQQLVGDLYADPDLMAAAAPMLSVDERAVLRRAPGRGWTPADVPLLDEAAELLGEDGTEAQRLVERLRRRRIEYAQGALDIVEGSRSVDWEDEPESEVLTATDLIDAARLAERHVAGEYLTPAQRAAADRRWAFGHIIVDEAQELSPMAWRLLMRRSPSRSMTIVGDVAQTGALGGASSWGGVLEPYVADRWRLADLTVNYRTPAEIMDLAAGVLATVDPEAVPPRSVRSTGAAPTIVEVPRAGLAGALTAETVRAMAEVGDGRVGVIVPAERLDELARAMDDAVPEAAIGEHAELESRVVVLTVAQTKGLEFDSVIVADPGGIVAESPRGRSDLYVAMTRATQRLRLLHHGDVADVLRTGQPG